MVDAKETRACLMCRERLGYMRGLCARCYDKLARQVREKQTTWAELEQAGRVLPRAPSPWRRRPA